MKEKIIIVSGDSYAAGDELGADFLIPNYNKDLVDVRKPAESDRIRFKKFLELNGLINIKGLDIRREYIKKCRKLAWPAHLQQISNVEVINVGQGGLSNHEICHRAHTVYFEKIANGYAPEDILVLLMVTSPYRIGMPCHDGRFGGDYNYQSFSGHNLDNISKSNYFPNRVEAILDWFGSHKDWDMIWSSYAHLESTKKLIESSGSSVQFITSGLFDNFFDDEESGRQFNDLEKNKIKIIRNNIQFFADFGKFVRRNIPVSKLPGGHFSQEANNKFAEYVWSKLNE